MGTRRAGFPTTLVTGVLLCAVIGTVAAVIGFGFMLGFDLAGQALDAMGA